MARVRIDDARDLLVRRMIGLVLFEARTALGMSTRVAAERIGLVRSGLWRLETANTNVALAPVMRAARVYGLTFSEVVRRAEELAENASPDEVLTAGLVARGMMTREGARR